MAQTYTRQSSFSDGDSITAALFNNEYNQLVNAFTYSSSDASATGHRHDGSAGQGGNIFKIGDLDFLNKVEIDSTNNRVGFYVEVSSAAVEQLRIQDGAIVPVTDNDIDLGTSSLEFKDAFFDGTLTTDALVADTADINGGTVDGATIGANSASTGAFTSVTTTGNVDVGGNLTVTGTTTFNGGTLTLGDAADDNVVFGADVNSNIIPNTDNTYDLGSSSQEWKDLYVDGIAYLDGINFNGTAITSTAAELNILDGVTSTAAELNILDGVTSTTAELNILDGVTSSTAELNILDGVTATTSELNILDGVTSTATELNILDGVTATAAELNILDGVTSTTAELNILDGVTSTTAELNILDGVTATAAEINVLDGYTGSVTELNYLDSLHATGVTSTEFDFLDGVTSNIQTQLDSKISATLTSEQVQDIVGAMVSSNTESGITVTYEDGDGTLDFTVGTLNQDTTGNAATATALETARTIHGVSFDGTANIDLSEVIQDTVGAMVSSNTESGITVAYEDSDGTLDFTVGTLNQDTTGNAATATALETTRTIHGVSFDGTSNIDLTEVIQDTVGAMVSSNTETGIAVTYEDSDGTLDFVVSGTSSAADDITTGDAAVTIGTSSGAITLDTPSDIHLDVGGQIKLDLNGTLYGNLFNTSNNFGIHVAQQDKDLIISGNDGGSSINALTLDMSDAGTAIFNHDVRVGDNSFFICGAGDDVAISSDGTHGTIATGNGNFSVDCANTIILDADDGEIQFKDAGTEIGIILMSNQDFKFESKVQDKDIIFRGNDGGSVINALTLDMSEEGDATFNNNIKLGDNGQVIFGAGTDLVIFSDGTDGKIQAQGDLRLDTAGQDIRLLSSGTQYGSFSVSSSNLQITSSIQDKDILFVGDDGGSGVTALTLDMSEAGAATFNNNVTAFSDERLKDNIETLEDGLDKVEQLRGVTYTRDDRENIGVIAQEVEKILPEIVKTADDEMGTKSVDYSRITAVLIEAVKELSARVKELENK